jgi:hypothetical protein
MPYFMNSFRTPKSGKLAEVADLVQKSLEDLGVPGIVSVTVSPPTPHLEPAKVTAAVNIENAEGVDALVDRLFDNGMQAIKDRSDISELCMHENLSFSRVMASSVNIPNNFAPKFINRTFIPVKLGKLPEMLDLQSTWHAEIEHPFVYNISVPTGGPVSSVRVTHIVESFASLEALNEKIFSDPRMNNLRDMISGSGVRSLGRITYAKVA